MIIKKLGMLFMFSLSGLIVSVAVCWSDCSTITILYNERVPYIKTTPDGVEGLVATPAALAFKKAGIPFSWKKTPTRRQMAMLKNNDSCDCMVGWFKNSEREKFAKYTNHIYQDKPQIALARFDNDNLQNITSVDFILSNPGLTLLCKEGYSYGIFLDAKFTQHKPTIFRATVENINMLRMIYYKRNDYFFIAPEEADALIESSGISKKDFKHVKFSDMPEGEKRYILCNQKVGDEIIEKLNAAITEYVLKK